MKKLRFLILVLTTGLSLITAAQFTVSGTVLDSVTREPLFNASVFCQNTTSGTVTNKEGDSDVQAQWGFKTIQFELGEDGSYQGWGFRVMAKAGDDDDVSAHRRVF